MIDINKHRFFLTRILKDIYDDIELSNTLEFIGGTDIMFFYALPRFFVDMDFNLHKYEKEDQVYEKLRKIILRHGEIHDEAKKYTGLLITLDYGLDQRKRKVEVST